MLFLDYKNQFTRLYQCNPSIFLFFDKSLVALKKNVSAIHQNKKSNHNIFAKKYHNS